MPSERLSDQELYDSIRVAFKRLEFKGKEAAQRMGLSIILYSEFRINFCKTYVVLVELVSLK